MGIDVKDMPAFLELLQHLFAAACDGIAFFQIERRSSDFEELNPRSRIETRVQSSRSVLTSVPCLINRFVAVSGGSQVMRVIIGFATS